ncbi:uncharacterized protein LOC134206045 [Armigeres subalbatus]|uniref:uncharacterized protein LOC134206045 n=1 Tax=Armigeres subalbatus TaxID=124917 RepID=UPI002ED320D1
MNVDNNVPGAVAAGGQLASAISVKLPDFWKNDPNMWFAQAEAQFHLARITQDETKFWHIVARIDQTVICHISDLVNTPPVINKYQAVKDRLIARFALSPQADIEQLLGSSDLGDLRPSHLLARMQEIATALNVDDGIMKTLFLQRLPNHVRTILSISDGSLVKLAEMADRMVESSTNVASCSTPTAEASALDYSSLKGEIEALTAEIRRLKAGPSRSRSRSSSRPGGAEDTVCWYHRKYGGRAEHCRTPSSKKLDSRLPESAQVGGDSGSRRLVVFDKTSSIRYLIDTGSDV